MDEPWLCTGGKHLAPVTGGSCPCGMVTRIPAPQRPRVEPLPEVLAMRALYLSEWSESLEAAASRVLSELEAAASRVVRELEAAASRVVRELEAAASRLLREQADRLMGARFTTGRVLGAGDADRLVVFSRIEDGQPSALTYTAPQAAAREVVTTVLEGARATLSAGVHRAPVDSDARRVEVAAPVTASNHNAAEVGRRRPPASGGASTSPWPLQEEGGRDRAHGQRGQRTHKKDGRKPRQQTGRAKRALSADGALRPPVARPEGRPMGSPCIFEAHGSEALYEAA